MRTAVGIIAAAALGCLLPLCAQEKPESSAPAVYQVEFNIRDGGEGAAQPTQHYTMVIDESRKGVFQAGSRISAPEGSSQGSYDVGMKTECSVHGSNGKVALSGVIEMSKVTGQVNTGALSEPIIGQIKTVFHTSVALGTPTVITATDRQTVEATVTKLD
jgi:hypothetical protein